MTPASGGREPPAATEVRTAPYVTTGNASDPHAKPCTVGGQSGVCLYVSHDMDGVTAPGGNSYAMDVTNGWFSTDGINWSRSGTRAASLPWASTAPTVSASNRSQESA